jgi:spore coat protein A, manganese oxidase
MRSPVIFEPCSVITVQHALADLDDGPGALAAPHWMDPLLISWASLQVARRPWRSTTEQTKGLRSTMKISRSEFLKLGLMGGTALVLPFGTPGCTSVGQNLTGRLLRSEARLPEPFRVPLPVPPVLRPVRSDATADYYEVTQKAGRAEILPGPKTEVWGYEGVFPGPTIESRSGRRTVVRHRNELPVPTVVHLHGGKTPPEHDGYPTDLILPVGEGWDGGHGGHRDAVSEGTKEYVYPLDQRAATLWYHDHRMDFTGPQVYRGLAGFHIVRDDQEDALPLPKGDKEIPLMICDRSFTEDGSFLYPSVDPSLKGEAGVTDEYMPGILGDVILVNGVPWPFMEVSNTRYRFRVLNASNARRYELALDPVPRDGASFVQVGSDGGLLGAPISHRMIPIAQAERFDVVIDFSGYPVGTTVTLANRLGRHRTAEVMQFRVAREEKEESTIPERLSDTREFDTLDESIAEVRRTFKFTPGEQRNGMLIWTINGKPFDPARMDARPRLGSTEIWELTAGPAHPVHLHLVHFKVLSRNNGEPLPTDAGWKDTVDLTAGERATVIARFNGWRGRYTFHCHNLEHEDMMMMANFEVV